MLNKALWEIPLQRYCALPLLFLLSVLNAGCSSKERTQVEKEFSGSVKSAVTVSVHGSVRIYKAAESGSGGSNDGATRPANFACIADIKYS